MKPELPTLHSAFNTFEIIQQSSFLMLLFATKLSDPLNQSIVMTEAEGPLEVLIGQSVIKMEKL
jgi:hypothetical protein